MSSKSTKTNASPIAAKGKKRKYPGQMPPADSIVPVTDKTSYAKDKGKAKSKKIVQVNLFDPKGIHDCLDNEDKRNKKRKFDDQYLPRSSFRLLLRRQNKAQEIKKRAETFIRTVELIKRPIELRDPATKILFMASLDLYPKSEPGSGPIVIIKQSSSNNDIQTNSESSESSEQDIPIIEVLSDQDDTYFNSSVSNSSSDSFFYPEICMEMKAKEIISSTPIPQSKRKVGSKIKGKVARTTAASAASRKPLTQRQHNSISTNKTAVPNPVTKPADDCKTVKREAAQPDVCHVPCVQSKVPEKKSDGGLDKFNDLESIKRMLAKLHTHIAPVEEEIQIITIE